MKNHTHTPGPKSRIRALRSELRAQNFDGLIIPMSDEYQNEYVPAHSKRIAWLTDFTGSAGTVIVLGKKAAAFTDGRYEIQIAQQIDPTIYEIRDISTCAPRDWLAANIKKNSVIAYDPWLFTPNAVNIFREAIEEGGGALVPLNYNPVDKIWKTQPQKPTGKITPHLKCHSGMTSANKRSIITKKLKNSNCSSIVISAPDSIAWLLNIRGTDVPHTPLPLSFFVLNSDGRGTLFVNRKKITSELIKHLGNKVVIKDESKFAAYLRAMGIEKLNVQVDPASTSEWIFQSLKNSGANLVLANDPCQLLKAIKNPTELKGARAAHLRDGAALCRFLHWLSENALKGTIDEQLAENVLKSYRKENDNFRDLSFPTISGSGPNSAIIHYCATKKSNRKLCHGDVYLVDSGAQYIDGTTDVTRTVAIGLPSDEIRDRFTRVLKGHIAVATCRFPYGTTGGQIDAMARRPLWNAGLDFEHGTGHGVGSYLNVHEGPQRISKSKDGPALEVGMIISNEPGYYKPGEYGIRIENLVAVQETEILGAEKKMLEFATLTLAPIDRQCLNTSIMRPDELTWLNEYHKRVYEEISSLVDVATRDWLYQVTRPVNLSD